METTSRVVWPFFLGKMTHQMEMASALAPVLDAFRSLGVEYRIGGSVASSALGVARATLDIDLVVRLEGRHAGPFCRLLQDRYYADEAAMKEAIARRSSFNVIHLATMIKVDVFVLKAGAFDQTAFERTRREALGPLQEVNFCTAEDVVLRKLQWYRDGGEVSERQWADVLGILQVQAGLLDWTYLTRWARELDLGALLARARSTASG